MRVPRISAVLPPLLALSACNLPTIYKPNPPSGEIEPEGGQIVSPQLQNQIVSEHWTREQVIDELGSPDAVSDSMKAIGYWRCGSYWFYNPPYLVKQWEVQCQQFGVWFDLADCAIKTGDERVQRPPVLGCTAEAWLSSKRGGGCPR
jgi:hypothetical protein